MSRQRFRQPLSFFMMLLVIGLPVGAAEKVPEKKESVNLAWMEAGKADAKAAFAKQLATAPKVAAYPHIIGEYLWSGRADDQYKPFFMFEFRLRGATRVLNSAKYRVMTLDPTRKPQTTGPWVELGQIASGATRDLSYKLNCPIFQAFQIDIAWKDGQESYVVWDKVAMLPMALSDIASMSFLINLNQNFEYDGGKKIAAVSYHVWNIGGKPAKDVVQILQFKDGKGKIVHRHEFIPLKGDMAAGYVGEVKLNVPQVPSFIDMSIVTKMSEVSTLDPGSFTGVEDVEVAQVRAEGKSLKAKVRNGFKTPLMGVVVSITLTDAEGKALKNVDLNVGELKAGEERELTADISTAPSWSGYEVGWKSSDSTVKAGAPAAAVANPVLASDGLEFVITASKPGKDGLAVSGLLRNQRTTDINGLVVSFILPDGSKDGVVVTLKPGKLLVGDDLAVNFTAAGVKAINGMSFKWVSTKSK
jgi:hypothetical protein